jgi:hypothetical protein
MMHIANAEMNAVLHPFMTTKITNICIQVSPTSILNVKMLVEEVEDIVRAKAI